MKQVQRSKTFANVNDPCIRKKFCKLVSRQASIHTEQDRVNAKLISTEIWCTRLQVKSVAM